MEGFPEEGTQEELGESIPGRGKSLGKCWEGGRGAQSSRRPGWLEGMSHGEDGRNREQKGFSCFPSHGEELGFGGVQFPIGGTSVSPAGSRLPSRAQARSTQASPCLASRLLHGFP